MRLRVPLALMLFAATPTVTRAATTCPPIHTDISECAPLAYVPPDARIDTPMISARVSVAMCEAGKRMDALKLRDDDASRAALERAAAPTLAVLDNLAATGSPDWQIIANNLRGQLYVAMTVRLRNSIPLITQTTGPGYAALMARHDRVEQKASPWLASADESFQKVAQIASANPSMGTNPVVAAAVRNSSASVVALAPTAKRPSAARG